MKEIWSEALQNLHTLRDFFRFGLSLMNASDLSYGHGTDNAEDELHALILGALSLPWDLPDTLWDARLLDSEKKKLVSFLEQRIEKHIPVPYLTKQAYFCDLSFYVDERVLIPRSPIGELIRNRFAPWLAEENIVQILDLCTGSGSIAIALAYAFEEAEIDAVDISQDALDVARINCEKHQLSSRLHLFLSDCYEKLPRKHYDLIISNPPYVSAEEMRTLPKEFLHEPSLALEADKEGLAVVERIIEGAKEYLSEEGILVVEVGNSAETLQEAYPNIPFTWLDFEAGGQGVFLLTKKEILAHW